MIQNRFGLRNNKAIFNKLIRVILVVTVLYLLLYLLLGISAVALASNLAAETPTPTLTLTPFATPKPAVARQIVQETTLIHHHWALYHWQDNILSCNVFLDTQDEPNPAQVVFSCGDEISQEWVNTPACETPNEPQICEGLYLKNLGELKSIVEETIQVPPPIGRSGLG